jgi:hypothetical protein
MHGLGLSLYPPKSATDATGPKRPATASPLVRGFCCAPIYSQERLSSFVTYTLRRILPIESRPHPVHPYTNPDLHGKLRGRVVVGVDQLYQRSDVL